MCRLLVLGEDADCRGHDRRQCRANLAPRLSRMQTAKATVSRGRSARLRMAWTRGTEATDSEADEGMRLTRWIAGPARHSQILS